jgi:serine/threonine protein kinase
MFYRLYEGNLLRLISHPSCDEPPPPFARWMSKMVKQMTTAIECLHAEKILHLDIKPENILFDHAAGDTQPDFNLGDFGLAMAQAEVCRVRGVGTDFYMDPEIAFALSAPGAASVI